MFRVWLLALALALPACAAPESPPPPAPERPYAWDHARVTSVLRARLLGFGFEAVEVEREVLVWPAPDHPDALLVAVPPCPPIPVGEWPAGAWLTAGGCGRWWVWENAAVAPADGQTRVHVRD